MTAFFHGCIAASLIILSLAAILVFIRLLKGPSLADRVMAFDTIAILAINLIAIFAIATHHSVYLDIVIALALISFLGTVAFAQFIEHQLKPKQGEKNHD